MNGFAALAVKEAAVATGHGPSLLPAIAPSALDGFAVGALLSALCVLLVMVTRDISRRSRQPARNGAPVSLRPLPKIPELTAALSPAPVHLAALVQLAAPTAASPFADESAEIVVARPAREDTARGDTVRGDTIRGDTIREDTIREDTIREDTAQLPEHSFPTPAVSFQAPEVTSAGHRRKHRLADADRPERQDRLERLDRLPESRRGPGRHAAPSIGASGRMASKRALHPMAARD